MKEAKTYSPEQIAGAERVIKILLALPKETRETTAIVANAYIDGFLAGQALKEGEAGREVLANQ